MAIELSQKRLQLLRDMAPSATRVAVLWNASNPSMAARVQEIQRAAETLELTLQPLGVERPEDFEPAFDGASRGRADALMVVVDGLTARHQQRILAFATTERLPAIAARLQASLMVVGSGRPGLVERIFAGSVASGVAALAPCAVAVVPPDAKLDAVR